MLVSWCGSWARLYISSRSGNWQNMVSSSLPRVRTQAYVLLGASWHLQPNSSLESLSREAVRKNHRTIELVTNTISISIIRRYNTSYSVLPHLHWERLSMSLCRLPVQELVEVPKLCSPLYSTRKLCLPCTRVTPHVSCVMLGTCHVSHVT